MGQRADQRVSTLYDFLRIAAIPYAQVDPSRVGAGLPDLQQVPGLLPISQQFLASQQFLGNGMTAASSLGTLQAPFAPPEAYLGNAMKAILQLRAAGLWL